MKGPDNLNYQTRVNVDWSQFVVILIFVTYNKLFPFHGMCINFFRLIG